jgi:hypothetical protein
MASMLIIGTVMKSFVLSLFLISSLILGSSAAMAEINSSGVLGFTAWRQSRIDEARAALEKIQTEAQIDKPQAARPQNVKKKYQQYQQAQLNVQIVQELTLTDYFTLYLSQLKDRSMMIDAAKKLSVEEIADLMTAYQKTLAVPSASTTADAALPLLAPNASKN